VVNELASLRARQRPSHSASHEQVCHCGDETPRFGFGRSVRWRHVGTPRANVLAPRRWKQSRLLEGPQAARAFPFSCGSGGGRWGGVGGEQNGNAGGLFMQLAGALSLLPAGRAEMAAATRETTTRRRLL